MPIYLYQCETCGLRFEEFQRMSDDPLTHCRECDGHVHRVIQPVGVIFRGSGFYVTDNRKSASPTLAPPKEGDKEKVEAPGEPSDEGAPATEKAESETSSTTDDAS